MRKAIDFIVNQPWAIETEALHNVLAIAERANEKPELVEARLGRPLENTQVMELRENGVAVLPITGPIFRHANLFTAISGATSLDILARDFNAALEDHAVRSIVLNIDSPGGEATGIAEFAAMVRAAGKPVTAYVGGMAASAAYWIAAAAQHLVICETALLGSIGVVASFRAEKDGPTKIISSQSPLKQASPETVEGRAEVQRVVDDLAAVFVRAVASYRATDPETVIADFGQGGLLVGAKAVTAGMADKLGSFESIIAGYTGQPSKEDLSMSDKTEGPEVTAAWLQANHPAVHIEIMKAGEDNAIATLGPDLEAKGASAERQRIQAVLDQSMPGHEALVRTLAFDGHTSAEQAAVQVLAAEKQLRAQAKTDLRADEPAPVASGASETGAATGAGVDQNMPIEDRCKAEWDKDPALRTEFGELDTYIAYARAESEGKVRKLGGKTA